MRTRLMLFLYLPVILVAGLWPFQFWPPNLVRESKDAGLVFGNRGIAYAHNIRWQSSETTGFTLELWLRAAGPVTTRFAHIVCITQNDSCSDLFLGQWNSTPILVTRFRDAAGSMRTAKIGITDALPARRWVYIAVTSGANGTRFYVDGLLRDEQKAPVAIAGDREILVIGNNPVGEEGWDGCIAAIAIYGHELAQNEVRHRFESWKTTATPPEPSHNAAWFNFTGQRPTSISLDIPRAGTVYVPRRFVPPGRVMLHWKLTLNRSGISDIGLNFFGFVPFGFLLFAVLKQRKRKWVAFASCVALGIALSAAIEITQAFMPGRDSSAVDLLFNSIGTLAGALVALACVHSPFCIHRVAHCGERPDA